MRPFLITKLNERHPATGYVPHSPCCILGSENEAMASDDARGRLGREEEVEAEMEIEVDSASGSMFPKLPVSIRPCGGGVRTEAKCGVYLNPVTPATD